MLGDKGTAREMQEDLYERQCRVLGETHPSTLNTLNSLAFSYSGKGDKDKAMELFEKAYRQRLATLGPEHSETMRSLNNLSVTAFNFHDHETAVRWADELCACTSDAIQEFLDNMAIVYKNCGEFAKAKAVEARKK